MISLRSSITQKLLNYFFINPDEERYVNDLARKLKVDPKNLSNKLKELEKEGLFCSENKGQEKYYVCRNFHPQNASVGRVWPGADGVSKSVI